MKHLLLASLSLLVIDMPTAFAVHKHWQCPYAQEPHERFSPLCERGGNQQGGAGAPAQQGNGAAASGGSNGNGGVPGVPGVPGGGGGCQGAGGGNCGIGLGGGGGNGTGNEGNGRGPRR